ncbi:MAG: PAS domain S-box protein, partial [Calditrichaeota bacterium]|nr:PAS domain S-box protein [Calditrichota bacterium]
MGNSQKKVKPYQPSTEAYRGLLENVHDAIIFQYANDAILLHTLEGEILEVNPKTSGQFGYSDAELLKMNIAGLYAPGQAEIAAHGWATLLENRFANFEMELMHKSGIRFPAEVSAVLFTLRGREMVHAIVRDMTRRQRAAKLQAALYGIADRASYIEDMGEFYAAMHRIVG